ncbi:GH25 family lysozyme [Butyrivibrio sp. JL13D10]|uniref:GH25 family lysozyme n=1 Tax=Butyrivibrio sp. JL13D10 TaxID=3236815 RepID=UPI0038B438A7
MKMTNKIIAGIFSAAVIAMAVPALNASAAGLKYSGVYTKEITIEEPEVDSSSDASSTIPVPSPSTTGITGTTPVAGADANAEETEDIQSEKLRVMSGMQFVIAATRYDDEIDTNRNKKYFKFKSSNKKVAKVTSKGVVTTKKAGKCDITVTNKSDGVKYVIHLTVAKTCKVSSIKLNVTNKNYKKLGKTFQLTANVKPKKYTYAPVLWGSTNSDVATVNNRGFVSIKGYGTCSVYCKAGSNNKIAKCNIKVIDPNAPKENGGNTSVSSLTYRTGKLVDISSHNTVNNWQQLKNSCDGVIIRVGYRGYSQGSLNEDIKFRSNVYNCQQHGIPFSVYFFTTAVNEAEGAEEGNWIANELAGMNISMPVFIDTESSGTGSGRSDNLSKPQRTAAVRAACAQLQARGIPAGVYGSTSWLYNRVDMGQLPFSVWVADYRGFCGYGGTKFAWQYTSNGTGYGVANRCDASNWYN